MSSARLGPTALFGSTVGVPPRTSSYGVARRRIDHHTFVTTTERSLVLTIDHNDETHSIKLRPFSWDPLRMSMGGMMMPSYD